MPKRDFSHSVSSKIRDLQERREHLEAAVPDRAINLAVTLCLHLSELISLAGYGLIRGSGCLDSAPARGVGASTFGEVRV